VALLAVERAIDHVARVNERGRELPIEIGIVLDHQETQDRAPTAAADPGSQGRIGDGGRYCAIT
jgi:hypothetical protein